MHNVFPRLNSVCPINILKIFCSGGAGGGGGVSSDGQTSKALAISVKKEDTLVMDTKLKIIDILQFILDVRLDYRISCLLSIFKREFDESERTDRIRRGVSNGGGGGAGGPGSDVRGIDLEAIAAQGCEMSNELVVSTMPCGQGGNDCM